MNPADLTDMQLDALLSQMRMEKDAAHNRAVELREQIVPLKREQDRRRIQESRQRRAERILSGDEERDQTVKLG